MTAAVPVAFWLLPCAADADWLRARIHILSQRHGGPAFDPHITLHVAECQPGCDLEGALNRVAGRCAALSLSTLATGESSAYYKALFADIAVDRGHGGSSLLGLRRQLVQELLTAPFDLERALASYDFLPHLSLLYGKPSQPLRTKLAQENDLRGQEIFFDRIAAVRPAAGHADLARVAHWDVFGHQRLRG